MGYQIVYGKSFIKTPKGRIVPLTLSGSNNCTEFINGREVRERNWGCFVPDSFLLLPQEEFLAACEEKYPVNTKYHYEAFKSGSKWVYGEELFNWLERGVKNAALLEDYRTKDERPVALKCYVSWYENSNFKSDCEKVLKTSSELDDWLDLAYRFKQDKKSDFCFDILGVREPLRTQKEIAGPVVCKLRADCYLFKYDENTMQFGNDIKKAIIFESMDDARNKLGAERCKSRKFVSAKSLREKPYVIGIEGDSAKIYKYILGKRNPVCRFTYNIQCAKGFASEKKAQRYIESMSGYSSQKRMVVLKKPEK